MGRHKLEPYVIQKAQFAKKFLAILLTEKNIEDIAKYINGYFCKNCFVLAGEELFITKANDDRMSIHIGEYFILTDELEMFGMRRQDFERFFVKEEVKRRK